MYLLEIESLLQAVNLFTLLHIADTLKKSILKVIIEYMHLEIEVTLPLFSLPCEDFEELVMLS